MGAIPPSSFRLPPVFGRAANASEKVTNQKQIEHSKQVSEEQARIEQDHERNTYVLDHLAQTISGEAMIKELQEKRRRYLDRIKEVMKKNEDEIKRKQIDQETLIRDLEIIAQNLLERNEKLDEFFKFKVKIDEEANDEDANDEDASEEESQEDEDEQEKVAPDNIIPPHISL